MTRLITTALLLGLLGVGWAQTSQHGMMMHDMQSHMHTMMQQMQAVPMTGNADHDFAAMMIPHHEGAIEMAQTELKYGKDPALRAMARSIVTSQQKEIEQMQAWLKTHPSQSGSMMPGMMH